MHSTGTEHRYVGAEDDDYSWPLFSPATTEERVAEAGRKELRRRNAIKILWRFLNTWPNTGYKNLLRLTVV